MKERRPETSKKIQVLQVNKLYSPYTGGIEHIVQQIAEGLKERINIKVLVCNEKGKAKKEIINGVPVYRSASFGRWGNLPIPKHFVRDFKKLAKRADIVHVHMPFPFADLACLLSHYKGNLVISYHSDIVRQKKMMFFYRPIMKQFLKRADIILVATKGHIENSSYLKQFQDKCAVIPFGLEKNLENYAEKAIQNKKRTEEKKIQFLFVGRLVYYKGCDILLKAFAKLPETANLTIVGEGVLKKELIALSEQFKIEKRVEFLGELPEQKLWKLFEQCDVFVLPSVAKTEAFGIVQIEAMAFGKPVINTRLNSGVPYVSIDKVTGLTVEPNHIEELAKAMNWMIEHKKERLQMGENARRRVEEEYTSKKMLDRIMRVYESFMQEKEDRGLN